MHEAGHVPKNSEHTNTKNKNTHRGGPLGLGTSCKPYRNIANHIDTLQTI